MSSLPTCIDVNPFFEAGAENLGAAAGVWEHRRPAATPYEAYLGPPVPEAMPPYLPALPSLGLPPSSGSISSNLAFSRLRQISR